MLELKQTQVKINGFRVSETSPTQNGTIAAVTIDVDVELDVTDAGRFGGLARAVESVIADSNSRSGGGETDKDTIKIKIKRDLPLMSYTLARAGAENDDDVDGAIFDPSKPGSSVARKLTFNGECKNAEARVVKGILSASWKVDANLTPQQIAALSVMVKTAEVTITSTSVQAALNLDAGKRAEAEEAKGKAKATPRQQRRPAIAEAADALGDSAMPH